MALENRVRQLQLATVNLTPAAGPSQAENEARIRALTQERDNLLAKLGEANRSFTAAESRTPRRESAR